MANTTEAPANVPAASTLPTTPDKFLELRKLKSKRTLNDQVEDVVVSLVSNERFNALIAAVYDEQAVEGSLSADNIMAAILIRDKAGKMGYDELGKEKLATISKCLGVVLRRYGLSRRERRDTVSGQMITSSSNNGND